MERVTFSNLSIETRNLPIFVDIERRYPESSVGAIRDVSFRDLYIRTEAGALIQGMPERPVENLTMSNVTVRVDRAADYGDRRKPKGSARNSPDDRDTVYARKPAYLTLAHVRGFLLENIRVLIAEKAFRAYERSAVYGHELEDGVLRNIRQEPTGEAGQAPAIDIESFRRVQIKDS
jgi:hypothetical protein